MRGSVKLEVTNTHVEVVVDAHAVLGEGPSWDPRGQVVWWVDISNNLVHCFDPATGEDASFDVGQPVGAAVPRQSGGLILAVRDGFATFDPLAATLDLIAPVEIDRAENRMNDAKCDRAGRLWGGTMAFDESPRAGALYRLDADHSVTTMLTDVTCSNGLGWSLDDRLMYYIDSGNPQVDVFDYSLAAGEIRNRRRLIDLPPELGIPDGMTVDAQGHLWVAFWGGAALRRYTPNGALDRVLDVPAQQVTSMVFAGSELKDLYITSATEGMSPDDLQRHPHSGGLFRHRPGLVGRPTFSYQG